MSLLEDDVAYLFKVCALTNTTDSSEDHLIYSLKSNDQIPNGRFKLSMARTDNFITDMAKNIDLKQGEKTQ